MKTAEEWADNVPQDENSEGDLVDYISTNFIRQIQFDAMIEGMMRAADCAISAALMNHHDAEGKCNCGNCSARRAILTTAKQLIELSK